jgi:hypothetical protein
MAMPNFLIIGKAKSGTTALYHALQQHPQIYMSPRKEPGFFTFEDQHPNFNGPNDSAFNLGFITNLNDYQKLFAGTADHQTSGEASTVYLSWYQIEKTVANIWRYIPQVRLIAILRHPAEQAYSIFNYRRQLGREPFSDFAQALAAETSLTRSGWSPGCRYRQNGFYYQQLRHYYDRFPHQNIRVYLYEDWDQQPQATLQDILSFLQVESPQQPISIERHNTTILSHSRTLQTLLNRSGFLKILIKPFLSKRSRTKIIQTLQRVNSIKPPALDPEIREQLVRGCRQDILQLQDLIGRDLSHWLKTC